MKKSAKVSLVGLLAGVVMFTMTGCLGKPTQPEIPDDPTGGGVQTTIGDAYDYNDDGTASTRPVIPGGFYEPQLPITETTVKIADSSSITFADGSKQKTVTVGVPLTTADFAASTLDGHEVGGVALIGASDEIISFIKLSDFAPQDEVTIAPYYAPEKGENLLFGSNGFDYGSGIASSSITTTNALIDGYMGSIITYAPPISSANSIIRIKSTFDRKEDAEYTYYYTFTNYGEADLSFTVYQMNAGNNYTGEDAEPSEPIIIEPGKSQSVIIGQDINKNDSNAMTIIKFDEPLADGFKLGAVMAVADEIERIPARITIDAPQGFTVSDEYKLEVTTFDKLVLPTAEQVTNDTGVRFLDIWKYSDGRPINAGSRIYGDITITPVFVEQAKITVKLPEGLTLADSYETDVMTYDELTVPTAEQLIGEGFGAPTGWYDYNKGSIIGEGVTVTGNMTIAPYWATKQGYTHVSVGSGSWRGYNGDLVPGDFYIDGLMRGSFTYVGSNSNLSDDQLINGGDNGTFLGAMLSDTQPVTAGSAIRFDSAYAIESASYEFIYTVYNSGKSNLKLSIYQISASGEYKSTQGFYAYESRYRVEIELAPGESVSKVGQYALDKNGNALTYLVFEEDVDSFGFGISMGLKKIGAIGDAYKNQSPLDNYVTIDYDASNNRGLTVDESYLTQRAGRLLTAPTANQYTTPAGERVKSWKIIIDGVEHSLATSADYRGLRLPSSATVELVPVFEEYKTVTVSLPEGVTLNGYATSVRVFDGDTLTLPTAAQVTVEDGRAVLYWVTVDGADETRIDDGAYVTEDITIKPVLSAESGTRVTFTRGTLEDGFTISDEYINATRKIGDTLVLPTEGQYVNNTGKRLKGWKDAISGTVLTDGEPIGLESIALEPILAEFVTVSFELPQGFAFTENYIERYSIYDKGEALVLPSADDISQDAGNGAVFGWYNAATGTAISDGAELTTDVTIAPYWQVKGGYNYVQVGSGRNTGFNPQDVPGSLFSDTAAQSKSTYLGKTTSASSTAELVKGGSFGTFLGSIMYSDQPVTAGSAIRLDSKHPQTVNKNTVLEYVYTVYNGGSTNLKLSIYQISGSTEYRDPMKYDYESRYRVEINLAPGEGVSDKIAQYLLGSNGNALTYIVFEQDVDSYRLGIAIGSKIIDGAADVASVYKNQAALENNVTIAYEPSENGGITVSSSYLVKRAGRFVTAPSSGDYTAPSGVAVAKWQLTMNGEIYDLTDTVQSYECVTLSSRGATLTAVIADDVTVTFEANNGVSTSGAKTSYKQGEKLVLPAVTASATDGRTHVGWFDKATGNIVTDDTVVMGAMTIAPYFAPTGTKLTPLSGAKVGEAGGEYGPDNLSSAEFENTFTNTANVIGGDEIGIRLTCNKNFVAGDAFRFKTAYTLVNTKTYTFTYRFTNYGSGTVAFTLYQINSGTATAGTDSKQVEIAAGASVTVELTATKFSNGNALSYFVMSGAVEDLNLGVAMSVKEVTA